MFGRNKESVQVTTKPAKFDTVLGPSMKLTGNVVGKGSLRIEGEVDGEIEYEGDIVVGEKAVVRASVRAQTLTIAGKVEGNVSVSGRLEIVSTGKLIGDLEAGTFVVAEGALFRGRSGMGKEQVSEKNEKKPSAVQPRS